MSKVSDGGILYTVLLSVAISRSGKTIFLAQFAQPITEAGLLPDKKHVADSLAVAELPMEVLKSESIAAPSTAKMTMTMTM